jgi:hypothetical protein
LKVEKSSNEKTAKSSAKEAQYVMGSSYSSIQKETFMRAHGVSTRQCRPPIYDKDPYCDGQQVYDDGKPRDTTARNTGRLATTMTRRTRQPTHSGASKDTATRTTAEAKVATATATENTTTDVEKVATEKVAKVATATATIYDGGKGGMHGGYAGPSNGIEYMQVKPNCLNCVALGQPEKDMQQTRRGDGRPPTAAVQGEDERAGPRHQNEAVGEEMQKKRAALAPTPAVDAGGNKAMAADSYASNPSRSTHHQHYSYQAQAAQPSYYPSHPQEGGGGYGGSPSGSQLPYMRQVEHEREAKAEVDHTCFKPEESKCMQ